MPLIRFSVLSLLLAAFSLSVAAQNAAWFGTPVPPPLSDPRKPIMKHQDAFAPLPAHFPPRQGHHDELLDGAVLKTDQQRIVGFSLESLAAGDKVWGRRAARRSRVAASRRRSSSPDAERMRTSPVAT